MTSTVAIFAAAHRRWAPNQQPATVALLQRLAAFAAVAALAYPALVWPLIEAQLVSLDPVYGQPAIDGPPSPLLRIYFSTLFAVGLAAAATQARRQTIGLTRPLLVGVAVYLAWAGMTSIWSVEPDISARRAMLAVFIAGSIVTSTLASRDPDRILRIAFWMFAAMTVLCVWSLLTTPPTALGHAAIYPHKNYFAAVTATMMWFACLQLTNGDRATRPVAGLMLVAAVWFLIEARSKTCLGLAVVVPLLSYGAALIARHARISPAVTLPLSGLVLYGIYEFGAASGFWDFHAFAGTVFGDPSLTQRTDIWDFAMRKISEKPWLGYGYEVFWGAGPNSPSILEGPGFVSQMPHAHNGYLDILLQTGTVGLVIFTALMLAALHAAGRVATYSLGHAGFYLALLVFSLLFNFFETTWFRSFSLKSMVVVLAITLLAQRRGASQ